MTKKTDFPESPENFPNSTPEEKSGTKPFHSEEGEVLDDAAESSEDNGLDAYESTLLELGGLDALGEIPAIPEPPAEPIILPLPYVAPQPIVEKMHALIQQKKEEAEERERLAAMPKQPYRREEPRVGRNDPCPCGSGKKYKKCHMDKDLEES